MQYTTEQVGTNKQGVAVFRCICDCGKEVFLTNFLIHKPQKWCSNQCPALSKTRIVDLTGQRFGSLVVIERNGSCNKDALWSCQCDCGNPMEATTGDLRYGSVAGCGKRHNTLSAEERLEHKRAAGRRYNARNRARVKANKIRYERQLSIATPTWLSKSDWNEMNSIYLEAKRLTEETGTKYQVDHIVPLNGKLVCGLHVPANLQILTQSENVAKSNRYAEL